MTNIYRYNDRKAKIGKRIREERKDRKLRQDQLAEELSSRLNAGGHIVETISQGTISSWERGKTIPPIEKMACLAEIFQCDIGYLLCDYDMAHRDSVDVASLTGLSDRAANNLVALHNWEYYLAPFRKRVISDVLESELFAKILVDLERAYKIRCGLNTDLGDRDESTAQEAAELINYVNNGNWTKYTIHKGEDSARLEVISAGVKAQRLMEQIVDLEVSRKSEGIKYEKDMDNASRADKQPLP